VRGSAILVVLTVAVLAAAPAAPASELIDRNATNVRLDVGANGQALLSYRARRKQRHVLVWGAANAVHPAAGRRQVEFRLDYSGGWGASRRNVWKTLKNVCRPYSGPALEWLVAACTARDGSHWAVQSWQRALPNYGLDPGPSQAVWELRLSHWTGPLAELTIHLDWAYARFDHLFGTFSYTRPARLRLQVEAFRRAARRLRPERLPTRGTAPAGGARTAS
jgi:hypothetical protein